MTDSLNDILIECCKMRGCYPLMHRTLHEFDWFCSCAIFGTDPSIYSEIVQAETAGDEALAALRWSDLLALLQQDHRWENLAEGLTGGRQ